jgi:hypothetical protein
MTINLGDYYGENPACKKTNVSFSISGDNLKPDVITASIKTEPSISYAKGDKFTTKNGRILERPTGLWSLSTDRIMQSKSTQEHAISLLCKLECYQGFFENYINNRNFRVVVAIWWEATDGHGGYTLSSDVIKKLSLLCNDIDFFFVG